MIEGLSIWAKTLVLAVIIVSILEMLLPNNKTKKYIKMVMGIFILYNIISPLIKNKNSLSFEESELSKYMGNTTSLEVNQESMDKRIEELYIQEIEKDITKKVSKKGFDVKYCRVKAKFTGDENDMGINKITLRIEKSDKAPEESAQNAEELNNNTDEEIEKQLVTEIQKIKKVDTKVSKEKNDKEDTTNLEITIQDIQNLKKFLIEEYEVNEKCLEIN